MPDLAAFSADSFWAFLQVFSRVTALFVSAPVFGNKEIPSQTKIGLATILSLVLLPLVKSNLTRDVPTTLYGMVGILIGQIIIGLLIGFVVSLLFVAVRIGSSLLDYQMGFTQAATFNPQYNESISPITDLQSRYAVVLYLLGNGHWILIYALERSFDKLPVAHLTLGASALAMFTGMTYQMLLAGLQVAAPGAAVLLITDVAFAFLNRAMPQMQVFFIGMPLKVIIGLLVIVAVLPLLTVAISHLILGSSDDLSALVRGLKG